MKISFAATPVVLVLLTLLVGMSNAICQHTWAGQIYSYHGECDLLLINAPSFADGKGMEIHIRTTIWDNLYSFVETAALRIGDDVLEVASDGAYALNEVDQARFDGRHGTLGGFRVIHQQQQPSEDKHIFDVVVSPQENITISVYKELVSVEFEGASNDNYYDSLGLLGSFEDGMMLARNGTTLIDEDLDEFGQEWQIDPDQDMMLFQFERAPQLPQERCRVAAATSFEVQHRRRLGMVTRATIEEACAHLTPSSKHGVSVNDVMATGSWR